MKVNRGMKYLLYLVVMSGVLFLGTVTRISLLPSFAISIDVSNLINFLNPVALFFVLLVSLVVLIGTHSVKSVADAFVWMFRPLKKTVAELEMTLLALKTAMLTGLSAGFIMFLMELINALKSMELESGVSMLGAHIAIGLTAPIYGIILMLILLPVFAEIKRELIHEKEYTGRQSMPVRTKKK